MIYFTSDPHFGHKNIMKYEGRNFNTVDEMDSFILNQINRVVKKQDTLYILGDFSFHCATRTQELVRAIKCNKRLVLGNHDRAHSIKWWYDKGFQAVYDMSILLDGKYLLSHEPIENSGYINIHGHVHSEKRRKEHLWTNQQVNVCMDNTGFKLLTLDDIDKTYNILNGLYEY